MKRPAERGDMERTLADGPIGAAAGPPRSTPVRPDPPPAMDQAFGDAAGGRRETAGG